MSLEMESTYRNRQLAYTLDGYALENGILYVYKGTQIDADNYTTPANYTSDELVNYLSGNLIYTYSLNTVTLDVTNSANIIKTATGTGTASWFAIVRSGYVITGTITEQTVGGDLYIRDINVVSGNDVELLSLEFSFN